MTPQAFPMHSQLYPVISPAEASSSIDADEEATNTQRFDHSMERRQQLLSDLGESSIRQTLTTPNKQQKHERSFYKPKEPKVDLSIKATSAALHEKRRSIQVIPRTQFIQVKRPKHGQDADALDFDYQDTEFQPHLKGTSTLRPELQVKFGSKKKGKSVAREPLEN